MPKRTRQTDPSARPHMHDPPSGPEPASRAPLRGLIAIMAAAALVTMLLTPSAGVAQQTTDDRSTTERSDDRDRSDDGTPDTPDGTSRHGVQTFDDVQVERIRPGELPPRSDTSIPDVLRPAQEGASGGGALPNPPDADELKRTGDHVGPRVWAVIAVDKPAGNLQETPSLFRGHAVAVGADPPVLLTTYAWLKDANDVFVLTPDTSANDDHNSDDAPTDNARPTARRYDFDQATLAGQSSEWLDRHRDRLIQVDLFQPDKHRNLATLVPRDLSSMDLPAQGLELFDIDSESPARMYGHSPYASAKSLHMATLAADAPQSQALSYYLQTTWRPAHGAPLVTAEGQLVTVTAMQHPGDPAEPMTLVIPPIPLRSYLDEVRNSVGDD